MTSNKLTNNNWKEEAIRLAEDRGYSWRKIARILGKSKSTISDHLRKHFKGYVRPNNGMVPSYGQHDLNQKQAQDSVQSHVKILFIDIETSYFLLGGFGLFNQNFSVDQIEQDFTIISFCSKWQDSDEVYSCDVTEMSEVDLLWNLHALLTEADVVVAHNGRRFDLKKIRARMIINGLPPFPPVRIIDTLEICKKEFGFSSNKLQYITKTLCKRYVKSQHSKFPGYLLWKEFLKGNKEAVDEMVEYNAIDVLSLQEVYEILAPWSTKLPVFDVYEDDISDNSMWEEAGFVFTNLGKYKQYRNRITGQYRRGRVNLLSKEKRASLLSNIV